MTNTAKRIDDAPRLGKADASLPAFVALDAATIAVRAGTSFGDFTFAEETIIVRMAGLTVGRDYEIVINGAGDLASIFYGEAKPGESVLGGFHFAPGGNAPARSGGNAEAAIDPCSNWDNNFRPACLDPRGMVHVANSRGGPQVAPFWADKYLCAQDHAGGTSRYGVTIADGRNRPTKIDGSGTCEKLDFATAKAILAHHGKQLLSLDEFFAAAYGVTERQAAESRAETTALDAPRTSRFGLIQACGQRYVWGRDGDPDEPRACLFGGGWGSGDFAGSRCADVDNWPGHSDEWISARGRSDHLQLA